MLLQSHLLEHALDLCLHRRIALHFGGIRYRCTRSDAPLLRSFGLPAVDPVAGPGSLLAAEEDVAGGLQAVEAGRVPVDLSWGRRGLEGLHGGGAAPAHLSVGGNEGGPELRQSESR